MASSPKKYRFAMLRSFSLPPSSGHRRGLDASGLVYPGERPKRWRRKRLF
jgi:hypothetical protein